MPEQEGIEDIIKGLDDLEVEGQGQEQEEVQPEPQPQQGDENMAADYEALKKEHDELKQKVDEITTVMKAARDEDEARKSTASVLPISMDSFSDGDLDKYVVDLFSDEMIESANKPFVDDLGIERRKSVDKKTLEKITKAIIRGDGKAVIDMFAEASATVILGKDQDGNSSDAADDDGLSSVSEKVLDAYRGTEKYKAAKKVFAEFKKDKSDFEAWKELKPTGLPETFEEQLAEYIKMNMD